jgi:hypothetical protein
VAEETKKTGVAGERKPLPDRAALVAPPGEKSAPRRLAAAPASPPPPPSGPRTENPYVDDAVFSKLPSRIQRVLGEAAADSGRRPALPALRRLEGEERDRRTVLFASFLDDMTAVLRRRFLSDEIERQVYLEPDGDFSLRGGDGEVKVRAKCWEFFFLSRLARPLGPDGPAALRALFGDFFRFEIGDTAACRMKVETPVAFEREEGAAYLEATIEIGGWCDMRFAGASLFGNARVFVATLEPRIARSRNAPPPNAKGEKDFADLLKRRRGRK